jgi:hypothetical protein
MSIVTDFLNETIKPVCDAFFDQHAHEFDLTQNDGCGFYTETLIRHLRALGYVKVGHLKKNPSQTQFNGHANDAFLYRQGDPILYRAVDIIGSAEAKPPYTPTNPAPHKNFGIDEPRYQDSDWMAEPNSSPQPGPKMVQLAYDYARRPQGADFDVTVWSARTFHNAYMGPEGTPLGEKAGMERAQKEWCAALGVPVVPVPPTWNIGDPV